MDLNHSKLVLEELGRFHASSLLFEETLSPKTISESFEHMQEPNEDNEAFKIFEMMIKAQAKNASLYLKNLPKYEKCVKWLDANHDNLQRLYIDALKNNKKKLSEVLIHGDCWTNNILFKYNENSDPVDVRFVDLQISRKSSPVEEIHYFFYSSLSGDTRVNNFQLMLYTYYQSFSKVLLFARRKVPFTFKELFKRDGEK
ncbi:hypothetical protein Avbf_07680 [Armadillidium vulgare]|nr:hypothetical protein Avbf_07680 [Armadillidium vulgare]